MALNPAALLKLRKRYQIFSGQHPKILMFFKKVLPYAEKPGTVIEIKITDADGKNYVTNMRLTPEDVETLQILKSVR